MFGMLSKGALVGVLVQAVGPCAAPADPAKTDGTDGGAVETCETVTPPEVPALPQKWSTQFTATGGLVIDAVTADGKGGAVVAGRAKGAIQSGARTLEAAEGEAFRIFVAWVDGTGAVSDLQAISLYAGEGEPSPISIGEPGLDRQITIDEGGVHLAILGDDAYVTATWDGAAAVNGRRATSNGRGDVLLSKLSKADAGRAAVRMFGGALDDEAGGVLVSHTVLDPSDPAVRILAVLRGDVTIGDGLAVKAGKGELHELRVLPTVNKITDMPVASVEGALRVNDVADAQGITGVSVTFNGTLTRLDRDRTTLVSAGGTDVGFFTIGEPGVQLAMRFGSSGKDRGSHVRAAEDGTFALTVRTEGRDPDARADGTPDAPGDYVVNAHTAAFDLIKLEGHGGGSPDTIAYESSVLTAREAGSGLATGRRMITTGGGVLVLDAGTGAVVGEAKWRGTNGADTDGDTVFVTAREMGSGQATGRLVSFGL